MSLRVRLTPEEVHANHHRLIDEQAAAFRAAKTHTQRRDASKLVLTTVRGHLRHPHGHRGNLSPFATLDDLIAMHDELHDKP